MRIDALDGERATVSEHPDVDVLSTTCSEAAVNKVHWTSARYSSVKKRRAASQSKPEAGRSGGAHTRLPDERLDRRGQRVRRVMLLRLDSCRSRGDVDATLMWELRGRLKTQTRSQSMNRSLGRRRPRRRRRRRRTRCRAQRQRRWRLRRRRRLHRRTTATGSGGDSAYSSARRWTQGRAAMRSSRSAPCRARTPPATRTHCRASSESENELWIVKRCHRQKEHKGRRGEAHRLKSAGSVSKSASWTVFRPYFSERVRRPARALTAAKRSLSKVTLQHKFWGIHKISIKKRAKNIQFSTIRLIWITKEIDGYCKGTLKLANL